MVACTAKWGLGILFLGEKKLVEILNRAGP